MASHDKIKATEDNLSESEDNLRAQAVVFQAPGQLALQQVSMNKPGRDDVLVDVIATGISTGTERLLWAGEMPDFPGMGYPLIPGYETVGRVAAADTESPRAVGDWVFIGGAQCFPSYRNLFGGAASRIVVPAEKAQPVERELGHDALLLALAATAYHALHTDPERPTVPELVVGHGVLGRLLARICLALGYPPPTVWEINAARRHGAHGYQVIDPAQDTRRNYRCVVDVSGDSTVLDRCVPSLAPRQPNISPAQVVLAGFYKTPVSFEFAQAFMRELRIQVAAEWQPSDLAAVNALVRAGSLSLSGLITHTMPATQAASAYEIAFRDDQCLKMALDWGDQQNV
jgi:3-hydroxyethyl bacteriochlorophyllide a dehydrogenase